MSKIRQFFTDSAKKVKVYPRSIAKAIDVHGGGTVQDYLNGDKSIPKALDSEKLGGKTLTDIEKVETGSFGVSMDGVYFAVQYTKTGKIIEFRMDITLSHLTNVQYELTTALPFDVYAASGVCNLHVSAQIVGFGRLIGENRRLILTSNNAYGAPVTIQGSVTCILK